MDAWITLGQQRPLTPSGVCLSEPNHSPWVPGGPSNWLILAGKIDREGYKWPSSNCLTETQHIRTTGLHNLGLIYLPRESHPSPYPSPSQPSRPPEPRSRPSPDAFSPR